ncbi:MAG: transporter ATP-binding protein [Sphingomonas bacterium]|nr:ATP-binding cassette domain-containing protein [Sphingomonas bacterium]MDB5689626.1 transporter ATP-binding protein [Sphingomonas bacterium]
MSRPAGADIVWDGVTRRFPGQIRAAVDGVTLCVAAGSFVALVGGSGSGKSTLLKMVNRLVDPDAGVVRIGGTSVAAAAPHLLRRRIGYVFQNVGLFPHMDVAGNIALAGMLRGHEVDVADLLARVGLPADYAARRPRQLSGGEQQRVGVARALAGETAIMLMDEPFGALDPVTRDAIGTAYRALHDRLGLTTILVTHDMAEALLIADRILVMAAGRIVADATPAALLAGGQGAAADALMAVPKRQIERLARLSAHG